METTFLSITMTNPITTNQDMVKIFDKLSKIYYRITWNSNKKKKTNKTAGLDEIPADVWKTCHLNQILLEFCNDVKKKPN